jgi:hypothetical protein
MKCKELAAEYGVTPMQVGRLRKQFAPEETGDVSVETAALIRNYYDDLETVEMRKEMEEIVKPQFVDSICSYAQSGRNEVECKIRDEGKIQTVRALIPFLSDPMHLSGKPMKLEVIEYKSVKYYRHASLAGKAWSNL